MRDDKLLRRDFIRWMGLAGATAALPGIPSLTTRAMAANSASQAPLFVAFQAGGAYDVTLLCDPRGNRGESNPPNKGYTPQQIRTYGAIQVAPQIACVNDFVARYYRQMLIINGIDTSTIDHTTGERSSMSGMGALGFPVTAAVIGAALGPSMPASFMSNGGSNSTANIVGLTQLGGGISNALLTPMSGGTIHRPDVWAKLESSMANRLARQQTAAVASLRKQRLKLMQQALTGADAMSVLSNTIHDLEVSVPLASPAIASLSPVGYETALNIRVGLAGYVHGQTAALQMVSYGFDTHTNNDASQAEAFSWLFSAVDYLMRCADYLNIRNRMLVYIGSDFSRTPYYNDSDSGKDHWPTTSVMIINPSDKPDTPVNMVFGRTDSGLTPLAVNAATLRPDDQGTTIQPGHVHDALRRYFRVDQSAVCQRFNLRMNEQLPLLG